MEPKYQYVAEILRHDIASGHYKDGEALLTEAELKQKFGSAGRRCGRPYHYWKTTDW